MLITTFFTVTEAILLFLGIFSPFARIQEFWIFEEEFSIYNLILSLLDQQNFLLAVTILSFGVLMGWLLSQNLFEERSIFKRRVMLILALSLPVIFHGAFNYYGQADIFPSLALIFILVIKLSFQLSQQGPMIL